MKKVLFLAIATFAYVSVNAQAPVAAPLYDHTTEIQKSISIAAGTGAGSGTYNVTNGGNYSMTLEQTDWATALGAGYLSVIKGSKMSLKLDGTEKLSGAEAAAITTNTDYTKVINVTTDGTLIGTETVIDFDGNASGCVSTLTASLVVKAKPSFTKPAAGYITSTVLCSAADVVISFENTSVSTNDSKVKYGLEYTDASNATSPVFASIYYAVPAADQITIKQDQLAINGAGIYTVTVSEIYDEWSERIDPAAGAGNRSAIGTLGTAQVIKFTLLPEPSPVLKSHAL